MARYDYECDDSHITEKKFTIGTAPDMILCGCNLGARRKLATGTSFIINKVMSPPSKRLKPQHLGKP